MRECAVGRAAAASTLSFAVPPTRSLPLAALLRLCFPSWAFFELPSAPPTLEIRPCPDGNAPGAWVSALRVPPRHWWQTLIHPDGTRILASQALVEGLALQLLKGEYATAQPIGSEAIVAESSVSLALVSHVAEWAIAAGVRTSEDAGWQFRVVRHDAARPTVLYESSVLSGTNALRTDAAV